jgi:putative glycosyltransferase (TIGR04372 family)
VSFGHQALDLYMLSMRFPHKKVLVVYSDYGNVNRHIARSFSEVDILFLTHTALAQNLYRFIEFTKFKKMKFVIVKAVSNNAQLIWDCNTKDGVQIEGRYMVELTQLIKETNQKVVLPTKTITAFETLLHNIFPETKSKWFVSLYLRKKRAGNTLDVRDTTPEPYRLIIKRITEIGGFVLVGGDYNPHTLFPDLDGVYWQEDFSCDRSLFDAYALSQAALFIGTHSGPLIIANAFDVPSLITNCGFFYLSGYRDNQRVLFKRVRDAASGRVLSAAETFDFPVVSYTQSRENEFATAGLELVDNTDHELLDAAEEMLQEYILGNTQEIDQGLEDRFRAITPEKSVVRISPCRPSQSYLRNLNW